MSSASEKAPAQPFATAFRDWFVTVLEAEAQTTGRMFAGLASRERDFRPHPRSRSAWEVAWHIAADHWFLAGIAKGRFEPNPDQRHPNPCATGEELAAWYTGQMQEALAKIRGMSEAQLVAPLAIGVVETEGMPPLPAYQFLLWAHLHTVHHRGQLSAYLRPMGMAVPAVYGPSADT